MQSVYSEMFETLEFGMKKYQSIWQNNSIMLGCMNDLHQYIADLNTLALAQNKPLQGVTLDFNALRSKITDNAFIIKEGLSIYYNLHAMMDEIQLYSFKKSHLVRLRKNDFYVTVTDISQKATPLSAALIGFGISQQQIDDLSTDLAKYYNKIIRREKMNQSNKTVTASIRETIRNCRLMLKNRMDTIMNSNEVAFPEMVQSYFMCRRLQHKGGKRNYYSVIFSGLVSDKSTNNPLPNVVVTPETKGKPTVTDQQGKFTLKIYKKNAKALNFTLDGYEPVKLLLPEKRIKEHKKKVDVEMQLLGSTLKYVFPE